MKIELQRTFAMPAAASVTWLVLQDIDAVASCMPGAKITERVDARHYKGTVAMKVGPASLTFKGTIEVTERDEASRTLHLIAKGTDTSGTSVASFDLIARVQEVSEGLSEVVGRSEASVSGKAATFGGRLMDAIADQILKQFAANLTVKVAAHASQSAAPASVDNDATASAQTPDAIHGIALAWAVLMAWLRKVVAGGKQ